MDVSTDLQRRQIATLLKDARFLLDSATQKTMQAQVRLATRDLDEALLWLQQPNVDARPAIVSMVNMIIRIAALRLEMVKAALKRYGIGANATMLG